MKKLLYCLFSFLLFSLFLYACGGDTDTSNGNNETNAGVYVLEDFSADACKENLSKHVDLSDRYYNKGSEILATYTDKKGISAKGVGKTVMSSGNNCIAVRFHKTADELSAIFDRIESLTVRLLVIRQNGDFSYGVNVLGVYKVINTNEWIDFTITKQELGYALTSGAMENSVSAKEQFSNNFCSTGLGNQPRMINASLTLGVNMDVYIDGITCKLSDSIA